LPTTLTQLAHDIYRYTDTCNVYILRDGDAATLIDFGAGDVLDALPGIGVARLEWVLFTHHHREQCQGTDRLLRCGAKVAVPRAERDFFENPTHYRRVHPLLQDPFTVYGASYLRPPRQPILVNQTFGPMDVFEWHGHEIWTLSTPGNSPGSMTYLLRTDEGWLAFSGDLICGDARMHTWFDTEWDYGYASGLYALYNSVFSVERYSPARVFPSHDSVIDNPMEQLPQYRRKLKHLTQLYLRGWDWNYSVEARDNISRPSTVPHVWEISPHLYKFSGGSCSANWYMLLSDSGRALFVDCGCLDVQWLDERIAQMRERMGLRQIDAVIVTHTHGDHVVQTPHVRNRYGAAVWALDSFAETLEHPERFDLVAPVTAYGGADPVTVDRAFTRGETLEWEGFRLHFDWLPGQTIFGLVLYGEVDGRLVAFTGDNLFGSTDESGHEAVVARNPGIFEEGYLYCAEYLSKLSPDLILASHSNVIDNPRPQLDRFVDWTWKIREAYRNLSCDEDYRYGYDPFWVHAYPYRTLAQAGNTVELKLSVRNFRRRREKHLVRVRTPTGWTATPEALDGTTSPNGVQEYRVKIGVPADEISGVHLVTFDITLDGRRYGELFDAMVIVE